MYSCNTCMMQFYVSLNINKEIYFAFLHSKQKICTSLQNEFVSFDIHSALMHQVDHLTKKDSVLP